tara:strand:- start:27 stop:677 length:651 start_codon:yes stop_codon:yes gene_type:complete
MDGPLRPLDKLSMANMQEYAKLVGADYELVTGRPFRRNLTGACQKVHMIEEKYDAYDQVLMVDIDMFAPIGMTENIFDLQGVGLYADTQVMLHRKILGHAPMFSSANHAYWGGAIYKMPKPLRMKLRRHLGGDESWMLPYNKAYQFEDEGIMHTLAMLSGIRHTPEQYLARKWCYCSFLPEVEKAGFIHVRTKITPQGPKREKIDNYNALVAEGIL